MGWTNGILFSVPPQPPSCPSPPSMVSWSKKRSPTCCGKSCPTAMRAVSNYWEVCTIGSTISPSAESARSIREVQKKKRFERRKFETNLEQMGAPQRRGRICSCLPAKYAENGYIFRRKCETSSDKKDDSPSSGRSCSLPTCKYDERWTRNKAKTQN